MVNSSHPLRYGRHLTGERLEPRFCFNGVGFVSHVVDANEVGGPTSVFADDVDGDGDVDLFSAGTLIAWYENLDGNGTFGPQKVISAVARNYGPATLADLDGDGDTDVLATLLTSERGAPVEVVWFENTDGHGDFGLPNTIREAHRASRVDVSDLDGDEDLDVLLTTIRSGNDASNVELRWYENVEGPIRFQVKRVIRPSQTSYGNSPVYAADLDGDGDNDVLTEAYEDGQRTNRSTVVWYENADGNGRFIRRDVIDRTPSPDGSLYAVDVNGDRKLDVLRAGWTNPHFEIAWYENIDGHGRFGPKNSLKTQVDRRLEATYPVDMDGDGDIDIVFASYPSFASSVAEPEGEIGWYENADGQGDFVSRHVNSTAEVVTLSLDAADIDGDGDMDVVGGGSGMLVWYEQAPFQAGDSNRDGEFNQLDIVQVLQAAKYLTADPATWSEGDWNNDGLFDQKDVAAALQTGNYLLGPYIDAALTEPSER